MPPRPPRLRRIHDYFFPHERNNHRPHFFSAASVATIAVIVIVFELGSFAQTTLVFPRTNFLASVLPGVLLSLTNEARAGNDLPTVTRSALLDQAAQAAANDMAAKGYFAHVSPSGTTPWDWLTSVGYRYQYAGENLAVNFTDSQAVETAWLESPAHRANIMKREYAEVGFGTANGTLDGQTTTFVVEFFATPEAAAAPAPIAAAPAPAAPAPSVAPAVPSDATVLGAAAVAAPAAPHASWLALVLTSPLSAMEAFASALFLLVAFLLLIAVAARARVPHASVLIGGALLLALALGILVINPKIAAQVSVPAQGASTTTVPLAR